MVAYGAEESQFVELWLPPGRQSAAPVVVLVHGGCWLADYDIAHIRPLAAALAKNGFAVWAPEYRRVGESGGGWPGTFVDIANGIDALATYDEPLLDRERIVLAGHSAGGHLALWAAGRERLAPDSPLYTESPARFSGVLGLAAFPDNANEGRAVVARAPEITEDDRKQDGQHQQRQDTWQRQKGIAMIDLDAAPRIRASVIQDLVPQPIGETRSEPLRARVLA